MQRIVYSRHGDPQDVLEQVDEKVGAPGTGEAIVAVEATPVHIADLKCIRGERSFRFPLPATPGFEGIGRIVALGPETAGWKFGDRVFLWFATGIWQDQVRVKADSLVSAPEGDAVQLCMLPINPVTAHLIVEDHANLQPGVWLIQNAANSACGLYLIELARRRGFRTVNVVRRASLIPLVHQAGGDVALVDGDDLAARVNSATGGAPIRLGIDAVAGTATTRIGECLADGGTVLNYGMMSELPCQLPADMVFLRDIRLQGFYTRRQLARRTPEEKAAIYGFLGGLIADGSLTTRIAGTFSLDQVKTACALAAQTGDARPGKVVLVPGH